jgi:hypothetical protein
MGSLTLKCLHMAERLHRSKQLDLFQQPQNLFTNLLINPHKKSSMDPFSRMFNVGDMEKYSIVLGNIFPH